MGELLWITMRVMGVLVCTVGMVAFIKDHVLSKQSMFRAPKGGKVIPMRRMRARGYTLIELLITVAITGILLTLAVGVVALVTLLICRGM